MADKERKLSDSEIAFVKEQARLLAAELSWHARGPVRLHLTANGLGFTYDAGGDGTIIDVHVNPKVLWEIRNREKAIAVFYGIGFHELAHHLWPAHEFYKLAGEKGFQSLFNLLDDEQNERRGRARSPEWGRYFQMTVAMTVFPKKRTMAKDAYERRWDEFAYHFRRNLPMGVTDPVVVEALGMIPKNYKDLTKQELYDLTASVHATLSRGIDMPEPVKTEPPKPEEKPKPPEPEKKEEEPKIPFNPPFWKGLFKSVWSYVFLAVCVAAWAFFFGRKGLGGWDNALWTLLGVTVFAAGFLGLLMWIDKRQRMKGMKGKTPPKKPSGPLVDAAKTAGDRLKQAWGGVKKVAGRVWAKVQHPIDAVAAMIPEPVARIMDQFFQRCAYWLRRARAGLIRLWHGICWLGKKTWSGVLRIYRSRIFRTIVVAMPIAMLLLMIVSVIMKMNWKLLIILLLLLLLLGILAWLFRKKLKSFIQGIADAGGDPLSPPPDLRRHDDEPLEFNVITNVVPVAANQAELDRLLPEVIPLAQQMRRYFEQCGLVPVEKEDSDVGHDLTDELERVALGETSVLVDEEKKPRASVHIEMTIDCSGSMGTDKIRLAKRFGLLVEESIRGVNGVSAHFWGFTHTAIYDCGTAGQGRISGLKSEGGNNDAAGLWHMYQSALSSGKDLRILLMVSDGKPTECTWSALNNLVMRLESAGFIPIQIAVDQIDDPAFKRFFVDLVGQPMATAVIEFGRMLTGLVEESK